MSKCKIDDLPSTPNVNPIAPDKTDTLGVVEKYKDLMEASLDERSLYERSKATILELSKDLNLTEKERMDVVAGQITQMTVGLSGNAMQTALGWAKEQTETGYSVALIKAQAEKTTAEGMLAMSKICESEKQIALICAKIEETTATSLRENGRIAQRDLVDSCKVTALYDEGLKYEQILQVDASKYQILADAYRKSGNVEIGTDGVDGQTKGLDGDKYGHTASQMNIANRQIVSFEDSKRNHAVNASSQTIGQMYAAEITPDSIILQNYNRGMEYLLSDSVLSIPGGSASLSGGTITYGHTDPLFPDPNDPGHWITDNLDGNGSMLNQAHKNQITMRFEFDPNGNTRDGDTLVIRYGQGTYNSYLAITAGHIADGYADFAMPSVELTDNADPQKTNIAVYDTELFVQDFSGNKSINSLLTVRIKYLKSL